MDADCLYAWRYLLSQTLAYDCLNVKTGGGSGGGDLNFFFEITFHIWCES